MAIRSRGGRRGEGVAGEGGRGGAKKRLGDDLTEVKEERQNEE